uniref:Uncharacterized protein n=1 Tax=Anopheles atroparvus TaxID=41427 RepID=A0A182J3P6_ANOAO
MLERFTLSNVRPTAASRRCTVKSSGRESSFQRRASDPPAPGLFLQIVVKIQRLAWVNSGFATEPPEDRTMAPVVLSGADGKHSGSWFMALSLIISIIPTFYLFRRFCDATKEKTETVPARDRSDTLDHLKDTSRCMGSSGSGTDTFPEAA